MGRANDSMDFAQGHDELKGHISVLYVWSVTLQTLDGLVMNWHKCCLY